MCAEQEAARRREMVEVCREIYSQRLVCGTGGNVSVRLGSSLLVTPTGCSLARVTEADLVRVGLDGRMEEPAPATKELPTHLALYRAFSDTMAVVHVHSFYSICVGIMPDVVPSRDVMPPYTANLVLKVGPVPLIPFAKAGSDALSNVVVQAFRAEGVRAVLLQNHGVVTVGSSLWDALYTAEMVEENARIHVTLGGSGRHLSAADLELLDRKPGGVQD